MEEQKDKDKMVCNCPWCRCTQGSRGHCHGWIILRIVIVILAVLFAFWLGLRLGELRASYYNMGYYGRGGHYGYGMPMMRGTSGYGGVPMMPYGASATSTAR